MSFKSWIKTLQAIAGAKTSGPSRRRAYGQRQAPRTRLQLEYLEDRLAPAVALTYGGAGTALLLNELVSAATHVTVSEPFANSLRIDLNGATFDATSTTTSSGLTYQNAGSPSTSTFANIDISTANNITTLTANLAGDQLDFGGIADSVGGVGNLSASATTINVNGAIDLTHATNTGAVSMTAATINVNSSVATSGGGTLSLTAQANIALASGSSITSASGDITLSANQQVTPTSGNFNGIDVNNATIGSTSGAIKLLGRGGDDSSGGQYGVLIEQGGVVGSGTTGTVTVDGIGGASLGFNNYGVFVGGVAGAIQGTITSGGGDVKVSGQGGGTLAGNGANDGVIVELGVVNAGGMGNVNIMGTGGLSSGGNNYGIYTLTYQTTITSSGGNVMLTGTGGGSGVDDIGVYVANASLVTAGGTGTVTVTGTGAASPGDGNRGVEIVAGDIKSSGGSVSVVGNGGGSGSSSGNSGVELYTTTGLQGSSISAAGPGDVTVQGFGGATSGDNNYGVYVGTGGGHYASAIYATVGNYIGGNVKVTGSGGGTGASASNYGVFIDSGGYVDSNGVLSAGGNEIVTVLGTGGAAVGDKNYGVYVAGTITSSGADVSVIGQGGGTSSSGSNYGVEIGPGGVVGEGTTGTVTVFGTGGNSSGDSNWGVMVASSVNSTPRGTITSGGGPVNVTGQAGGTGAGAYNYGVFVYGGLVTAGSLGNLIVTGTGGASSGGSDYGIHLYNGGEVSSSGGNVQLIGKGAGSGPLGIGISVNASLVHASGAGDVSLSGTGAASAGGSNRGVILGNMSAITSSGGEVTVFGQGGGPGFNVNFGPNIGVEVYDSAITSGGGDVQVTGVEGTGASGLSIIIDSNGSITTNGGNVTLIGDSMNIAGPVSAKPAGSATFLQYTSGVSINLGSATDPIGGPLSLSNNELNLVSAGTINIGDLNAGTLTVSSAISHVSDANFNVVTGRNIIFNSGTSWTSTTGNLDFEANQGGTPASGNFVGIAVNNAAIGSTSGNITLHGRGGVYFGGDQYGVGIGAGSVVGSGTTGTVSVQGSGGDGGNDDEGVYVSGTITSGGGNVAVTGQGGSSGQSGRNHGVIVTGVVSAGAMGTVTVRGTGGASGGAPSHGVAVRGSGSKITSSGGNVQVTGQPGQFDSFGIEADSNGIISTTGTANVTLTADSMFFDATVSINAGSNTVTLQNDSSGTTINLGTAPGGTLGLTNAELNDVTAGTLVIGRNDSSASGTITVSAAIAMTTPTNLKLTTAAGSSIVFGASGSLNAGGGNVNLDPGAIVAGGAPIDITGATVSLTAGSGGIGTSATPLAVSAANLDTTTTGHSNQYLSASGATTIDPTGLNAGTGTITLSGGIFQADSTITGNVVNNGATLDGTGTINGNVSGSGTFSPGDAPGIMTINGNFTPAGTVNFEVNSPYATAGTDFDQYKVSGAVDLSGATVTFLNNSDTTAPAANSVLTLISKTSAGPTTASSSPAEGATVTIGSRTFHISYNGGDGNDVVLVAASTPDLSLTNTGLTVNENSIGTVIGSTNLSISDGSDPPATLVYTLTAVPSYGTLRNNGTALSVSSTFTQDDVNNNRLTYDNTGGAGFDSFQFTASNSTDGDSLGTQTFRILSEDVTPPVTTPKTFLVDGFTQISPNANGWFNEPAINVGLTATDTGSGVNSTYYTIDNGSRQTYTGQFSVSGDGVHTVTYYSFDNAGNNESVKSLTIRIDSTPPSVTVDPPPNGTTDLPFTITGTDSDSTSGISNISVQVYNTRLSQFIVINGVATVNTNGTWSYTFTPGSSQYGTCWAVANAFDLAGNQTQTAQSSTFTVSAVDDLSLTTNSGLTVNESSTANSITAAQLSVSDGSDAPTGLVYTLTAAPAHGTLKNNTSALGAGGTFTQDDINNNKVTYDNSGGSATDSFTFTLADSTDGDSLGSTTFTISVTNLATTTKLSTSNSSPVYGTPVTLTATVVPTLGSTAPTPGSVTFFINGTTLGTVTNATTDASHDSIFTYVMTATQLLVDGEAAQAVTATYTAGTGFTGSSSTNTVTETVAPAALTVTANNKFKVYGDPNPTLDGTLTGVVSGDNITASYATTATQFSNVIAGGYPITATLNDPSKRLANYTVTNTSGTLTINPANQTITWSNPAGITYGTALGATQLNATVAGVSGGSPTGALSYSPVGGTVLNAGVQKALMVTAPATTNYNAANKSVHIDVAQRALTITALAYVKTYDGNTSAGVKPIITSGTLVGGDTANFMETYDTRNAGSGKTLTPSGTVNDNNSGNNYTYTFVPSSGTILQELLVILPSPFTKPYDGNTSATGAVPNIVSGTVFLPDILNFAVTYADKNVGTFKMLNPTANVSDSNGGNNYVCVTVPMPNGTITQRTLTVTATAVNKIYTGTQTANVTLSDNRVSGDKLTVNNASALFADKNVGTAKTVTVSGISISGPDAGNYVLQNTTATTTANITPASVKYTIHNDNQTYGTPANLAKDLPPIIPTGVNGENLAITYQSTGDYPGSNVGTYPITPMLLSNGTGLLSNYAVTLINGTLTVKKATPTIQLSSSNNPAGVGSTVTFLVVMNYNGGLAPTGTVDFFYTTKNGTRINLATRVLVNGAATYTTSSLLQGTYDIYADYNGDSNYLPTTSAVLFQRIRGIFG